MGFSEIKYLFDDIENKYCCRQRTGEHRGLLLGFGEKVFHRKSNRRDTFNGEWELGTYHIPWRILMDEKIVIGSSDASNYSTISKFDDALQAVKLGNFEGIKFNKTLKIISLELTGNMKVQFIPCSNKNEWFHVFMPNNKHLEYSNSNWSITKW